MKFSLACLSVLAMVASVASVARANGVISGQPTANAIVAELAGHTLTCVSATDRVTLNADRSGGLRMVASYAGNISGTLDTNNEGAGEECGGLSARVSGANFIIVDSYNDCERGNWGYEIDVSTAALAAHTRRFGAVAVSMIDGSRNSNVQSMVCTLN